MVKYGYIENLPGYRFGDDGNVWRDDAGHWVPVPLPPNPKGNYCSVSLRQNGKPKRCLVHHLILHAFRGERPEGHIGRHLNDVKTDNRLDNLAYGTLKDNAQDALRNGRRRGKRRHCKVDPAVAVIRDQRKAIGLTQKQAAARYGCAQASWCAWERGDGGSIEVWSKMATAVGLKLRLRLVPADDAGEDEDI